MAQEVGYFDDNVVYAEGPFVFCNPCKNGYRVEVQNRASKSGAPCLPDISIYKLLEMEGRVREENGHYFHKTHNKQEIVQIVDYLNDLVKKGLIKEVNYNWVF